MRIKEESGQYRYSGACLITKDLRFETACLPAIRRNHSLFRAFVVSFRIRPPIKARKTCFDGVWPTAIAFTVKTAQRNENHDHATHVNGERHKSCLFLFLFYFSIRLGFFFCNLLCDPRSLKLKSPIHHPYAPFVLRPDKSLVHSKSCDTAINISVFSIVSSICGRGIYHPNHELFILMIRSCRHSGSGKCTQRGLCTHAFL